MPATDLDDPAVATSGTVIEEADIAVAEELAQHRQNPWVRVLGSFSEIADQGPCFALCGAVLGVGLSSGRMKMAEAGARMLASVLLATAIKGAVKSVVSRTRPHVLIDDARYEVQPVGPDGGDWHSFPSGHTADAVAAAAALARVFPTARIGAYAVAGTIAAVQIPRAKHYPLDVAAGAVVGFVSEMIVDRVAASLLDHLLPER